MLLDHMSFVATHQPPNPLAVARRSIESELAKLQADRAALDAEIAKREQFLEASAALFGGVPATNGKPSTTSLADLPKTGYGALTNAVKLLIKHPPGMTVRELTQALHAAGFVSDVNDPGPVRTVVKGLRKRTNPIAYDPDTGRYTASK